MKIRGSWEMIASHAKIIPSKSFHHSKAAWHRARAQNTSHQDRRKVNWFTRHIGKSENAETHKMRTFVLHRGGTRDVAGGKLDCGASIIPVLLPSSIHPCQRKAHSTWADTSRDDWQNPVYVVAPRSQADDMMLLGAVQGMCVSFQ